MKKRNNLISLLLAGTVCAACACTLTGCGHSEQPSTDRAAEDGLKVVATVFPGYDWAVNLLEGSGVTPLLMMKNGVDMHSFQPTAADIVSVSDADLFIYVGGESDTWVPDALSSARNDQMQTINMMEVLTNALHTEEVVEGMEHEHEEEEEAYDEHVWLSLENAQTVCTAVADALIALDTEHAELYRDNLTGYLSSLTALDEEYRTVVEASPRDTLLFGDRFPFIYLTEAYGLNYYAAFPGCSAETEASFSTISFLAGKVDELGLKTVLTIDGSDEKIARTIIENTSAKDAEILTLNSMQSVTDEQIESGMSYLSIMEENLDVLKNALA